MSAPEVLSPCFSECDSVSGLLDRDNNIKNSNKISKLDIFHQVVQSFRLPRTRPARDCDYATLGSCPNLPLLSSRTLSRDNNSSDKLLNVATARGNLTVYATGNPQADMSAMVDDVVQYSEKKVLGTFGFFNKE